jgi:hypothetical protein
MKKEKRKDLERSLHDLIHTHLTAQDPKAIDKVERSIRQASRMLTRKFSKAIKRIEKAKAKAAKAGSKKKIRSRKK